MLLAPPMKSLAKVSIQRHLWHFEKTGVLIWENGIACIHLCTFVFPSLRLFCNAQIGNVMRADGKDGRNDMGALI